MLAEHDIGKGRMDIFIPPNTIIECKIANAEAGIGQLYRYGQGITDARLILAVPVWCKKLDVLQISCKRAEIELWVVDITANTINGYTDVIGEVTVKARLLVPGKPGAAKLEVKTNEIRANSPRIF